MRVKKLKKKKQERKNERKKREKDTTAIQTKLQNVNVLDQFTPLMLKDNPRNPDRKLQTLKSDNQPRTIRFKNTRELSTFKSRDGKTKVETTQAAGSHTQGRVTKRTIICQTFHPTTYMGIWQPCLDNGYHVCMRGFSSRARIMGQRSDRAFPVCNFSFLLNGSP